MAKRKKKNKMQQLAMDTTTTGIVLGMGSVVAPTSAGNLAHLGAHMPGVINFQMGSSLIGGFSKLRKRKRKKH